MRHILSILCALLLAGCSTPQPTTPPLPQSMAVSAQVVGAVVPSTTAVTVPQDLSVTTTTGSSVALFVRSSNEWFQCASSLAGPWQNLSQLTAPVTFTWDAEVGADSYNLYQGVARGMYTSKFNAITNFITIPVVENQTNYFAVTMLESNMESGYSLELPYVPPIVAPKFNRP